MLRLRETDLQGTHPFRAAAGAAAAGAARDRTAGDCDIFSGMSAPHQISRRTFLAMAGSLPLVTRAASAAKQFPPALELYSVRDELSRDLPGTVRAVAKMGYEQVEFYSPYQAWAPEKAKEVRKLLDDLGLRCPSTHNSGASFSGDGMKKAIELNQILGSRKIVLASPGKIEGPDDWKRLAERLNAASEQMRPVGISAGFHNHAEEFMGPQGQRPMDVLAKGTHKDVVLQLDIGTCLKAGADPVAWINAHPGRTRSMHCKDWSAARGYAVVFGEGDAPWKKIFEAAEKTGGIEEYIIEQEEGPATEQLQRVERSLANWKKLRA
jgi:sugar phosphate isomerase/epimerase